MRFARIRSESQSTPGAPEIAPLVTMARGGDGTAFQRLVELHTDVVYGIAWSFLGEQEAAEDLVQEVFLRAWVKLPELRESERFSGWLTRMARNEAINWRRKRQSRSALVRLVPLEDAMESEMPTTDAHPGDSLDRTAREKAVEEAMLKLSPEERDLLHLHFHEDLSQRQIAERLNVHHTTVSRQIARAVGVLGSLVGLTERPAELKPVKAPARLRRRLAVLVAATVASPQVSSSLRAEIVSTAASGTGTSSSLFGPLVTGVMIMSATQKVLVVSAVALIGFGGWYALDGGAGSSNTAAAVSPAPLIHQEIAGRFFGEQAYDVPTGQTVRVNFAGENPEGIRHLLLTATPQQTLILKADTDNGPLEVTLDPRDPNPDIHLSHVQVWEERNLCYVLAAVPEQTETGFRFHFFASNRPELLPSAKAIEAEFAAGRIPKQEAARRLAQLLQGNGMLPNHPLTRAQVLHILQNEM